MKLMENLLWIFDLDDTLMWTQMDYERAKTQFCQFVYEKMQEKTPKLEDVLKLSVDIDSERFRTLEQPLEHSRFPGSLKKTFKRLCDERGVNYTDRDLQQAYDVGMVAFDSGKWKRNGMVEGAKETLHFLRDNGGYLLLMTKGDPVVQVPKFEALGIDKRGELFDDLRVVWSKTHMEFLDLLGSCPAKQAFSVGDSYRSDMVPALQLGMNGVYIPAPTIWRGESILDEQAKSKEYTGRMWTFKKISDIMDNYEELEAHAKEGLGLTA
jgi:putative hydrolase of the HAD superfamily